MSRILDVEQFFADSVPVIVSDSIDLEEGDNAQLDTQELANFFNTAMVIDEVRVQIQSPNAELSVGNFGGSIRLKLSMGRFALSSVYLPVGCLGPTFDGGTLDSVQLETGSFSPETLGPQFSNYSRLGFFRWRLPRPLVVPPGAALEAKISRQIEGLSQIYPSETTVTVNVAYAGRVSRKQFPRGSAIVPVPYVGLFTNTFTSANVVTSGQLDLYNPFREPLTVQRLIGRWQNIYLDSAAPEESFISLDANGTRGNTQIDFPPTQIRTFSGFNVTNGFIPGLSIWEANTRAFPANVQLERGEGFEVTIDATGGVPSTQAEGSAYNGSNTSFVTMIGWRNESLL